MGEISFEARNHCCFCGCLIKIAIMFYCCVEFLESVNPPPPFGVCLNLEIKLWTKILVVRRRLGSTFTYCI